MIGRFSIYLKQVFLFFQILKLIMIGRFLTYLKQVFVKQLLVTLNKFSLKFERL